MRAQRVEIARIEFQPSARHQKRARHPAGRKSDDALAGGESFLHHENLDMAIFDLADCASAYLQHDRLGGVLVLLARRAFRCYQIARWAGRCAAALAAPAR